MDDVYARTVRLLLRVAPDVFANRNFAMKGGTAINLFVRDMPRLSVDIDVAYLDWQAPRESALREISHEIDTLATRWRKIGLAYRKIPGKDLGETKLIVSSDDVQVKVEVNAVFRGTVLAPEHRSLHSVTAEAFSTEVALRTLAVDELYGSKLVAALDRQHPRDLFDVWRLFQSGGISDAMVECFVCYLAGHNRPMHEVLFSTDKDFTHEFEQNFAGMTREPVEHAMLVEARAALRGELRRRLTGRHKSFLIGLSRAEPDWSLLICPYAAELPALRWKLANLEKFRKHRPVEFARQARALESGLNE
jgi:hypothetical protein